MKVECPVFGIDGFVEVRGSNCRIKHSNGYANGARVYTIHTIAREHLGINVGNQLGIKTVKKNCLFVEKPRAGFDPATAALPRRCPTRLGYRGTEFLSEDNVRYEIKSLRSNFLAVVSYSNAFMVCVKNPIIVLSANRGGCPLNSFK